MDSSKSIITSGFSKLVSQAIKSGSTQMYFALGTGRDYWDTDGIPNPSVNISSLINEVYRRLIDPSKIVYVDPDTKQVSNNPTSMLRIEISFNNNEYHGVVREYGVFAVNATSALRSGTLVTYCNHERMIIPVDSVYQKFIYINT